MPQTHDDSVSSPAACAESHGIGTSALPSIGLLLFVAWFLIARLAVSGNLGNAAALSIPLAVMSTLVVAWAWQRGPGQA